MSTKHAAPTPDSVFLGGRVHTLVPGMAPVEALAIRAGRVQACGTNRAIAALAGPHTEVLALAGRTILPGLVDAHCHPTRGAIADLFTAKFSFDAGEEAVAAALRARLDADPQAEWIIGGRYGSDFFTRHAIPSPRGWLDAQAPGRAVYLRDDSGHNGWASSTALAKLGITRASVDPGGGRIGRDPLTGEPDGRLYEQADVEARARLPDWSPAQYRAGIREMCRIAHGYGITGLIDADASEPLLAAYQAADLDGELDLHVVAAISTTYGHRTTPLDHDAIAALAARYASPHVNTRTVKIYLDGVPTGARTAAMLDPYLPHADFPDRFCGYLHVEEDTLALDISAFEERGFVVKLHTAGDRAVHVALNAIERAHARTGRTDLRHELAHAGFIADADIPRFAALGVVADLSPYLWYPAPINQAIAAAVGPRSARYWPVRDLLESGAPLLSGSDWPAAVASMDPWKGLATLVTRSDPARPGAGAAWPAQAITVAQALEIFTRQGARALRREAETGDLAVGKSADFIVIDRDPLAIPPAEIAGTQVERTYFAGRCVHPHSA